MASQPLTIRNLTSSPITLTLLEQFTTPNSPSEPIRKLANIARNITSVVKLPSPAQPIIAADAIPNSTNPLCLSLPPLQSTTTDIIPTPAAVLRLTFTLSNAESHHVDIPTSSTSPTTLIPTSSSVIHQLTALHHPPTSHLTIFPSANLTRWMQPVPSSTFISALSIPGTHNSPTYHRALPSVRCQAVSPLIQLQNGVRFLDIRLQPESPLNPSHDGLILVHGVFPISLTGHKYFRDLLNDILNFLQQNPSETILLSLKREGPGQHTDQQVARILHDHYLSPHASSWYSSSAIPTLGATRGKIILIRRFAIDDHLQSLRRDETGQGWGLNAQSWTYNTATDTCPDGTICVQDFCEVSNSKIIDSKIRYTKDHLQRAATATATASSSSSSPSPSSSSASCTPSTPQAPTTTVEPSPPSSTTTTTTTTDNKPPTDGPSNQPDPSQQQKASSNRPLFINFLSASNFWNLTCWPEKVAAKLNPAICQWLCCQHGVGDAGKTENGAATGVVICDWLGRDGDWDLVRVVVGWNAGIGFDLI